MVSLVLRWSWVLSSLTCFLRAFSSSFRVSAILRTASTSGSASLALIAFFTAGQTKPLFSSLTKSASLSSSERLSSASSYSEAICARRSSWACKAASSAPISCSCTREKGKIRPAQPSWTSSSVPPFFFSTILGSTHFVAANPSR